MRVGREIAQRFAETMLYWRGHLRAKEVQDFLGVSERTARGLIADWRRFDAILPRYRPGAERCLVPPEEFDPGLAVTDPNVALSLLLVADRFPGQARNLLRSLNLSYIVGLRDRAVLGVLTYTGARVGALARLRRGRERDKDIKGDCGAVPGQPP